MMGKETVVAEYPLQLDYEKKYGIIKCPKCKYHIDRRNKDFQIFTCPQCNTLYRREENILLEIEIIQKEKTKKKIISFNLLEPIPEKYKQQWKPTPTPLDFDYFEYKAGVLKLVYLKTVRY